MYASVSFLHININLLNNGREQLKAKQELQGNVLQILSLKGTVRVCFLFKINIIIYGISGHAVNTQQFHKMLLT